MQAYSYRDIWKIAYPILISLLMEQLIGMTDTAFMGRIGEVELGACAIAGVYYMVIFMIGFGFCIGSQIIMARRNGERHYGEIGAIFYHGLYFLIAFALLAFIVSKTLSPLLLSKFVSSEHIYEAAMRYIDWRIFGFFFSFAATMFRSFYVATTQTKTLTLNSIIMVSSNVVFNWILVFGKLGLPAMGIAGAALGSVLAELVSLLFFITHTARRIDTRRYGLNTLPRIDRRIMKHILNISVWTMVQNFLSISTWFMFFIFVEHLGERSLAITNIIRSLSSFLFMIVSAYASTCGSLVSNLIGAGRADGAVCPRGTDLPGDVGVRPDLAVGDVHERLEDRRPELGAPVVQGQVEPAPLAGEIFVELVRGLEQDVCLPVLHAGEVAVGEVDPGDPSLSVLGDADGADQGDAREDARSRHEGSDASPDV